MTFNSEDDLFYHFRLEALWILAALSSVDEAEDFTLMFLSDFNDNQLTEDEEAAQADFIRNKSLVLENLDMFFKKNLVQPLDDIKSFMMILHFVNNIVVESIPGFSAKLIKETCFLSYLKVFSTNWNLLEPETKELVTVIVSNLVDKLQ